MRSKLKFRSFRNRSHVSRAPPDFALLTSTICIPNYVHKPRAPHKVDVFALDQLCCERACVEY